MASDSQPLQTEPTCPICGWSAIAQYVLDPILFEQMKVHYLGHIAQSLHRDEAMTQAMERELCQPTRYKIHRPDGSWYWSSDDPLEVVPFAPHVHTELTV